MTEDRIRYAPFCQDMTETWEGREHFWTCAKHGRQDELVPFYLELSPFALRYMACADCLEGHYEDVILPGEVKGVCSCGTHTEGKCDLCGISRCEKCLDKDNCCTTCVEALNNGTYPLS